MQIYYICFMYANKTRIFFKKYSSTHTHYIRLFRGCSFAPRLEHRPTHTPPTDQARRRVDPGHAPTHAQGTQAPPHQDRSPAPYPHISSPTGPRADLRLRSVAAGFPRERHFSRAVHRLKISELIWFLYHVNIVAKNI